MADALLRLWARGGWIGVDLFFVLSGFLVSGLLFREYQRCGTVSVSRFLIRRGLKIYPAFYFFLALTTLRVVLAHGLAALPVRALISEALFIQNYGPALWWHTWSLAVEEHFYLGSALLIHLLTRRARGNEDPYRSMPVIFLAVAAASLAARFLCGLQSPFAYSTHLFPTHLRLDGLMFGVCLSYLYHFRRGILAAVVRGREGWLLGLGAALLAPAFLFPVESTFLMYTLGLTGLYLGSGLVVLVLVLRVPGRVFLLDLPLVPHGEVPVRICISRAPAPSSTVAPRGPGLLRGDAGGGNRYGKADRVPRPPMAGSFVPFAFLLDDRGPAGQGRVHGRGAERSRLGPIHVPSSKLGPQLHEASVRRSRPTRCS